jgi:hypothetical protein
MEERIKVLNQNFPKPISEMIYHYIYYNNNIKLLDTSKIFGDKNKSALADIKYFMGISRNNLIVYDTKKKVSKLWTSYKSASGKVNFEPFLVDIKTTSNYIIILGGVPDYQSYVLIFTKNRTFVKKRFLYLGANCDTIYGLNIVVNKKKNLIYVPCLINKLIYIFDVTVGFIKKFSVFESPDYIYKYNNELYIYDYVEGCISNYDLDSYTKISEYKHKFLKKSNAFTHFLSGPKFIVDQNNFYVLTSNGKINIFDRHVLTYNTISLMSEHEYNFNIIQKKNIIYAIIEQTIYKYEKCVHPH